MPYQLLGSLALRALTAWVDHTSTTPGITSALAWSAPSEGIMMLSGSAAMALFAQVAAIIVTAWFAREVATKNVSKRFTIASVIGSYAWLSTASAAFLSATYSSVVLAGFLVGGCTVTWIAAFLVGGCPFPGRVPAEPRRTPWWQHSP